MQAQRDKTASDGGPSLMNVSEVTSSNEVGVVLLSDIAIFAMKID